MWSAYRHVCIPHSGRDRRMPHNVFGAAQATLYPLPPIQSPARLPRSSFKACRCPSLLGWPAHLIRQHVCNGNGVPVRFLELNHKGFVSGIDMYDCPNVTRQKSFLGIVNLTQETIAWNGEKLFKRDATSESDDLMFAEHAYPLPREAVSYFSTKVWLKPVAVSGLSESGFSGFKD